MYKPNMASAFSVHKIHFYFPMEWAPVNQYEDSLCISITYLIQDTSNCITQMITVSSCSCFSPIHWNQVLSWEWRCNWGSSDRRCSNYIWVINFIAYKGVPSIRFLKYFPVSVPFVHIEPTILPIQCIYRFIPSRGAACWKLLRNSND